MAKLTQFSEAANLAIHSLAYLGSCDPSELRSASQIARHLDVSEAHLGKVLQRLAKFGLVRSVRGAKGGFALARDPEAVTLLEIVVALAQVLEQRLCLKLWRLCQTLYDLRPILGKRIRSRPPRPRLLQLRRHLADSQVFRPGVSMHPRPQGCQPNSPVLRVLLH